MIFKKTIIHKKKTKSLQCGWRDCCNAYTLGKLTISESTENHRISITFQRDSRAAAFITQCKWTQKPCKFDNNSLSNCKERVNPIMEFFSYRRNCRTKRRGKRRVQKKHHNTHTHVPEEKEISRSSQGPPNPNLKPCKCEIGNCKKNRIQIFAYLNGDDWFFDGNKDSRTLFQTGVIWIVFPLLDLRTRSQFNDLFVQSSRARRASVTQREFAILRKATRRKLGLGFDGSFHLPLGLFLMFPVEEGN